MLKNEYIVFYPSNWLYNAGVIGFLKVLEELEDLEEKFEFTPDGKVKVPSKVFVRATDVLPTSIKALVKYFTKDEDIERWLNKKDKDGISNKEKFRYKVQTDFKNKEELGYRYFQTWGKLFGSRAPYQNLVQQGEWGDFSFISLIEEVVRNLDSKDLVCGFCNRKNISENWLRKRGSLEKRVSIMADPHTHAAQLGASIGEFPNSFWHNKWTTFICPLCVLMLIHHHVSFVSFNGSEIFINVPDFRLIYDLNNFLHTFIREYRAYGLEKLLGSTFIYWALKRKTLLGAWTLMNIEVIIKKRVRTAENRSETVIDYFDLPFHVTRILLDPEIASIIDKIGEEKIFDLIIEGKFSELEKINHIVLKTVLKLHNKEVVSADDPITKYISNYKDLSHLQRISKLLPKLYAKILKVLQTGGLR